MIAGAVGWFLRSGSEREENNAAVTPAPVAADIPAIMAKVVFDMVII